MRRALLPLLLLFLPSIALAGGSVQLLFFAGFDYETDGAGGPDPTPDTLLAIGDGFEMIGIVSTFGEALDALGGRAVRDRVVEIRRFAARQDLGPCHILFVSSSEQEHLAEVFESVENSNVLTAGDVDRFARMGGIINLTVRANRIRFSINRGAGERAGLTISSQLLNLAEIVDADDQLGPELAGADLDQN